MLTDSENNMMNPLFSLQSIGERRFFFLVLLLANFQIIQAVCRHDNIPSSDTSSSPASLFTSKGAIVSGMDQIYVHQSEKVKRKFKRKISPKPYKRKHKKEQKRSQSDKNNNITVSIFIRNTTSEKYLLALSDNHKKIVIPSQPTIKSFLLGSENKISVLTHLLVIFQKKIYKNHGFSSLRFCQNFKRPPPFLHTAIT